MATPDDLANRVTNLEHEVARLREQTLLARSDAGAARVLAAGADRDVAEVRAELRAHTQALNALRETQIEQGDAIIALRTEMRDGFATVHTGMSRIAALLQTITGPDQG